MDEMGSSHGTIVTMPQLSPPQPDMPEEGLQVTAPLFPSESTPITPELAVCSSEGRTVYFTGSQPVFEHACDDLASFHMIVAQFCAQGVCKQTDIIRTFGVPRRSLARWVSTFRSKGAPGFYQSLKPAPRRPRVLTPERLEQAQALLNDGESISSVSRIMDIKPDTLRKAILAGRLSKPMSKKNKT